MRAIVLAGGEGTRLRPLTRRTPKQLVPLLGRPLLEHLLADLRDAGVAQIVLALTRSPGSEAVRDAFGDGAALGIDLTYAYEESPLGSGGAIAGAAHGWDERFLVCNGDIVTNVDLSALVRAHEAHHASLSILLHEVADPSSFGVVALEAGGRISRFVEKPAPGAAPSRLINAGVWVFEPALLQRMHAQEFNRVENDLFPALAAAGDAIFGFALPGYWHDVGNSRAYLSANLDLLDRSEQREAIGEGTRVADGAELQRCVIGAGCTVATGATVRESVLWDGVHVAEGATVRRSILASGVTIEAGARVDGSVVAHGATVAAGEHLAPETAVEPDARYVATTGA